MTLFGITNITDGTCLRVTPFAAFYHKAGFSIVCITSKYKIKINKALQWLRADITLAKLLNKVMSGMTSEKQAILDVMTYVENKGLVWKVNRGAFARVGQLVGGCTERSSVRILGKRILVHHVVWFLHNGYWPSDRNEWIDHIDGNCLNNTIENLRVATPSQNNANRSKKHNQRFPKGVSINGNGSIRSIIRFEKRRYFLGAFKTIEEAAAAYQGASRVLHGEFSVFNRQDACSED